jgi:hypothetical protein
MLVISPDGRWLASAVGSAVGAATRHVQVRLWDTTTRREVSMFTFTAEGEISVGFARDSSAIVFGGSMNGAFRRALDAHEDALVIGEEESSPVFAPASSHESRWSISAAEGPALKITAKGEPTEATTRVIPLEREVNWAISPDDQWLVAGNDWGFQSWRLDNLAPGPAWPALRDGDRFRFLGFSGDGRWLVTEVTQGTMELRDGRTFEPVLRLTPPVDYALTRMTWAPDASAIYLMGVGPRVFCWDLTALRRELAARGLDGRDDPH